MSGRSQSFACPVAKALWLEYLHRNPGGLTIPPKLTHSTTETLNCFRIFSMWTVATIAKKSDSASNYAGAG